MIRVALVGSSGFVGGCLQREFRSHGCDAATVMRTELQAARPDTPLQLGLHDPVSLAEHVSECVERVPVDRLRPIVESFGQASGLVNAAGRAAPLETMSDELIWSNVGLPALLHRAARLAGIERFVHVSSAAVQGSGLLDETARYVPTTPYALTKAAGELTLLRSDASNMTSIVYRPTSVHGPERELTQRFARLLQLPVFPVVRSGVPMPITSGASVGRAVWNLVSAPIESAAVLIALHPDEGITQPLVAECCARGRPIPVASSVVRGSVRLLKQLPGEQFEGLGRRISAAFLGQQISARLLLESGMETIGARAVLAEAGLVVPGSGEPTANGLTDHESNRLNTTRAAMPEGEHLL